MKFIKEPALILCTIAALTTVVLVTGCSAQGKIQRHQAIADKHYAEGAYEKAELDYFNVLSLEGTNGHAIRQLGLIYEANGRFLRAYPFLVRALELSPEDAELRMKLAALQLSAGDINNARTNANLILAKIPTNDTAPLILAESARTPETIRETRASLEELQKQVGPTAPIMIGQATLLAREGKIPEAEVAIQSALKVDSRFAPAHHAAGLVALARGDSSNAAIHLKSSADLSPLRSSRWIQYAEFLIKTGRIQEGKQVLRSLTEKVPDYLPPWVSLAEVALAERDLTNAVSFAAQAVRKDPDNFNTQLLQARIQLAQGETDKTIVDLNRIAARYEKLPQVYYFLAVAYAMKNEMPNAVQNVNRAVALNPAYDDAILLQAQLNIRLENVDAAIASLNQFVSRRPAQPQGYILLINAYLAKRDFQAALTQCSRIGAIFPTNAAVPLVTGRILEQQGRTAEARAQYDRALTLDPNSLQALGQMVDLDIKAREFDSAVARVNAAIQRSGDSAVLQTLQAKVLVEKKDTEGAEKALLRAIEMDPNFHTAYMLLAKLYIDSNQKDKALIQMQETATRNPRDISTLMMLGTLQYERGEYDAARDSYTRLLSINPNFGPALNNLADIYSDKLGDLEKAYEAARKAREVLPGNPNVADTLGWILYKRGEYQRALSLVQESAENLPNEGVVLFHLGMIHYMLGNEEKSGTALERALATNKEFSGKEEASRRLAFLKSPPPADETKAVELLENLASKDPNDPIVISRLASLYERANAHDKAAALYERAVKNNPRNLFATVKLAEIYAGPMHDTKKAMDYAKVARNLAPDDPQIAHTLGRLAYESGDSAWSIGLLQESQRKLPENGEVLFDLAYSYLSVARIADAESTMRAAIRVNPNLSRADAGRRFLSLISAYQNPTTAAAVSTQLETSLRDDSNNLPALVLSGQLQEQRGEVSAAKKTYNEILQRYPLFTIAHKRLAILNALPEGDPQIALEHAVKARAAFPNDAEVAKTLGILTYNRKDYTRAAQLLGESSLKNPQDGETLLYLGLSQFQLKQKSQSQQTLRKALTLNLSPTLAEQANRALAQQN